MMKRRNLFLVLIAFLLFRLIPINLVDAHSVLEKATPEDGEQLKEPIDSIELTFSTKIENGSTLYLVGDTGEEIRPASIDISDDVLKAKFKDSLKSGTYQVNWKIVGADGHLVEKQYSFSISEPKDEQNNSTASHNDNKTETKQYSQDTEKQNSSDQKNNNDDEQSSLVSGIIIFLIILGVALSGWMLFGGRKK